MKKLWRSAVLLSVCACMQPMSALPIFADDAVYARQNTEHTYDEGVDGFYAWMGDEYSLQALEVLEYGRTQLGLKLDGSTRASTTNLDNVKLSLEYLKLGNDLRQKHQKPRLKVNSMAMAFSQVQTQVSSKSHNHSQIFEVGENLAWGYLHHKDGPYAGWYTQEKVLYDKNPNDPGAGHYINLIEISYYGVTGTAVCLDGWDCEGQIFMPGLSGSLSEDEYYNKFMEYYNLVEDTRPLEPGEVRKAVDPVWKQEGSKWTLEVKGSKAKTGMYDVNGAVYRIGEDGYMVTNSWYHVPDGDTYYFDNSGKAKTGWLYKDGSWHLFDKEGKRHSAGWASDGGKKYYFDDGVMLSVCWVRDDGKQYYLDKSGAMKTGWAYLNGHWYLFGADGVMRTSGYVDGGTIGSDGIWHQS